MTTRKDLDASGIGGYQIPVSGLVVRSHVTDGPGGALGRTVNVHLDNQAVANLVATIAELDPDLILRVAAAITEADVVAEKAASRSIRDSYERREHRHGGRLTPFGRIRLLSAAARGVLDPSLPSGKEPTTP